jgi:hypothetical protein
MLHRLAKEIGPYKLDQINADHKGMVTGINWSKRIFISKQYMGHSINHNYTRGRQEERRLEEELDRDAVHH